MNPEYMLRAVQNEVARGLTFEEAIDTLREAGFPSEAVDAAASVYQQRIQKIRSYTDGGVIEANRTGWYQGPQTGDIFWPTLKRVMTDRGWSNDVITSIDDASSRIVSLLDQPAKAAFSTRGLVLGYVQSGKTANFTAVLSKAADAGFKVFIVLAGIHNSLRRQTQKRLEKDLYGHDLGRWVQLTEVESDFNPRNNAESTFSAPSHQRVICVIKKNASRLRALKRWLKKAKDTVRAGCPVLVIDDEADQASVDAGKRRDERTVINKLIIDILALLPRSAYVGYTATPFANVLSDTTYEADLYPRHFIFDLPKPADYFGNERIFGSGAIDGDPSDDGLDVIRGVPDDEVFELKPRRRSEKDLFVPTVTDSLRDALHWFLLACGVRRARGQADKHMSMLIHTSVYTVVHKSFQAVLEREVASIRERIAAGDRAALRTVWSAETARVSATALGQQPVTFDDAIAQLDAVFSALQVTIENANSDSRLVYPDDRGTTQIIVGGNTLARGLTLEGLTVSFFIRATKLYDTLLQMGRWFGYRHGYMDLPRIWMTDDLRDHFQHLSLVEQELRRDIAYMEEQDLTPQDFRMRVRTHSTMAVTSPLKMKFAVEGSISFASQVKQTTYFCHRDAGWLETNTQAARTLLEAASEVRAADTVWDKHLLYRDVPVDAVREFLSTYQIHETHRDMRPKAMLRYVEDQLRDGRLNSWNIAVIGQSRGDTWSGLAPGHAVHLINRARMKNGLDETANIKALMSITDRTIDFGWANPTRDDYFKRGRDARYATRISQWRDGKDGHRKIDIDPESPGVRKPLLLLYPINKNSQPRGGSTVREALDAVAHVVGLAIVFPGAARLTPQSYVMPNLNIDDDVETPDDEDLEA